MSLRKLKRTTWLGFDPDKCCYRSCHGISTHWTAAGIERGWPLCSEHIKPQWQPSGIVIHKGRLAAALTEEDR
jgi:hypothetical protein